MVRRVYTINQYIYIPPQSHSSNLVLNQFIICLFAKVDSPILIAKSIAKLLPNKFLTQLPQALRFKVIASPNLDIPCIGQVFELVIV